MGFKDKDVKWTEVPSANGSSMLPAGGYVAVITDVDDVESKERIDFTYEIAEGEFKDFFANDDRAYVHQFSRWYTEKSMPYMAKFLNILDEANAGFDLSKWDNDPAKLVGLKVGIIVQREDYTNTKGEDRARMNVENFATPADINAGHFKLPEPKDNRKSHEQMSTDSAPKYDDSNILF